MPFLIPLPMYMLGAVVVVVQALVFSLLSTVYIGMADRRGRTSTERLDGFGILSGAGPMLTPGLPG